MLWSALSGALRSHLGSLELVSDSVRLVVMVAMMMVRMVAVRVFTRLNGGRVR